MNQQDPSAQKNVIFQVDDDQGWNAIGDKACHNLGLPNPIHATSTTEGIEIARTRTQDNVAIIILNREFPYRPGAAPTPAGGTFYLEELMENEEKSLWNQIGSPDVIRFSGEHFPIDRGAGIQNSPVIGSIGKFIEAEANLTAALSIMLAVRRQLARTDNRVILAVELFKKMHAKAKIDVLFTPEYHQRIAAIFADWPYQKTE